MVIKPYSSDLWFRFPAPHNPDKDILNFIYNKNDFSLKTEEAFDKHCNRLNKLAHSPFFLRMNGNRLKEIRKTENLWY